MSDEEINEAIARFLGWKSSEEILKYDGQYLKIKTKCRVWISPDSGEPKIKTPEYCNDLNLMHDAEKSMNEEQWFDYIDFMPGVWQEAVHSTARQRAEAFLRAVGRWEERA
jgi:hypothetical protein